MRCPDGWHERAMVQSMSRTVALLFAIVLVLASCASPSYDQPAFDVECREAGGRRLMVMYDFTLEAGCSGLSNALNTMNCGQAGADEAMRQLKVLGDGEDLDLGVIEDLC